MEEDRQTINNRVGVDVDPVLVVNFTLVFPA